MLANLLEKNPPVWYTEYIHVFCEIKKKGRCYEKIKLGFLENTFSYKK